MSILLSIHKQRLQGGARLSREVLDASLATLPEQHRRDALNCLLRTSDLVLKAVLNDFSTLAGSFTRSFGGTAVHVPDTCVGGIPSPGAYTYTLPGDQCEKVLSEARGWIPEENVSYAVRRELDWSGLKRFIEALNDEDALRAIAARIEGRMSSSPGLATDA